MESSSLTIDEIQQLKKKLEADIAELLLAFSQQTKLRVIEVKPCPNRISSDLPGTYQTTVLTNYPFR